MSAPQPDLIVMTFRQYLESLQIVLRASPQRAAMVYAAGSALTVGMALIVELVIIYRGLPRGRPGLRFRPRPAGLPTVSVVVPTYREGERLARTISSLLNQDYPKSLYEIVIAGEADDPTLPAALASIGLRAEDGYVGKVSGVTVKVSLGTSSKGKPSALNRALSIASGDVIGVLDSDGVAPPDSISRAVAALLAGYEAAQLPREITVPAWAKRGIRWAYVRGQAAEMRFYNRVLAPALMGFTGTAFLTGSGYFIWRWALDELGRWNEYAPTEDLDLTVRLLTEGGRIAFLEGPPVIEESLTSLRATVRQKERWVRGALMATFTAVRGIKRTWPLVLIFVMPAWGDLMTLWLGVIAIAGLSPELATWIVAWSAAWVAPLIAHYALALRNGGRGVQSIPGIVVVYLVAALLALPKLAFRRYEWRGSRT